jgi:glutathione S-transferase
LCHTSEVPVLLADHERVVLPDSASILSYLGDVHDIGYLLGHTPVQRAMIQRWVHWALNRFQQEITGTIVEERLLRYWRKEGAPRSDIMRVATQNLAAHLTYLESVLSSTPWIAGDVCSLADLAFACQISLADYLNMIVWERLPFLKHWYMLLKSRPSFRPMLADSLTGFAPSPQYRLLDF